MDGKSGCAGAPTGGAEDGIRVLPGFRTPLIETPVDGQNLTTMLGK